jgi:cytochrome c553
MRWRVRRAAGWISLTLGAIALGGFLLAWSGIYNIAASRGHWAAVEWLLEFGMKNSVRRRAWTITPPPLDDPDLVTLGAAHFHRACAHCHGAPGMRGDLTAQRALPPPPDLRHVSREWTDNELFWIVKHGIKYTGMPAWVALERDDEIWPVVAFLKKLRDLGRDDYRRLALGPAESPAQAGRTIATLGDISSIVGACARCHGAENNRPASALVPVLHGQPKEFLTAALRAYASGTRLSGIMQPVARELAPDVIGVVADYYASLPPPKPALPIAQQSSELATRGDVTAKIPACTGCHDAGALLIYPRLAGQNAAYMANRLRLWKNGLPASTDSEAVMAPIARLLTGEQIAEVSAYFAARAPGRQP